MTCTSSRLLNNLSLLFFIFFGLFRLTCKVQQPHFFPSGIFGCFFLPTALISVGSSALLVFRIWSFLILCICTVSVVLHLFHNLRIQSQRTLRSAVPEPLFRWRHKSMIDVVKLAMLRTSSQGRQTSVYLKCCAPAVSSSLAAYWPTCLVRYISEDDPFISKIDPEFFCL